MVSMSRPMLATRDQRVAARQMASPENMQLQGHAANLYELPPLKPSPARSREGNPNQVGIRGLLSRASSSGNLPHPPPLALFDDPTLDSKTNCADRASRANDVKPFSVFSPKASASTLRENAAKRGPIKGSPNPLASTSEEFPDVRQRMFDYDASRPRPRRARSLKKMSDLERQAQQELPAALSAFKRMQPEEESDRRTADFLCAEILARVGHTTPSPRSVLAAHLLEFQAWTQGAGSSDSTPAPADLVFIAQIARDTDHSFTTFLSLAPPTHPPPETPDSGWVEGSPGAEGAQYLGFGRPFKAKAAWRRAGAQQRAATTFAQRVGSAEGGERDGWFRQIICKRVALVGVKSERDVVVL
jgi:hypothetical protein